jgi:hypothetical protein
VAILAVVFTAENRSTSLSHVARLAAHLTFVWFSAPTAIGQSFIKKTCINGLKCVFYSRFSPLKKTNTDKKKRI